MARRLEWWPIGSHWRPSIVDYDRTLRSKGIESAVGTFPSGRGDVAILTQVLVLEPSVSVAKSGKDRKFNTWRELTVFAAIIS